MALTPLRQRASENRTRSEPAESEQPGDKRQHEGLTPEKGSAAKQQRVVQPGDFYSLPNELQLEVARQVAYQPNRQQANKELDNLRLTSPHSNGLILGTDDLREAILSLKRRPGVESRYIALCQDVVGGIPVKEALRQNGPLPKVDDSLRDGDLKNALRHATPKHLADLAECFSAREDPVSKKIFPASKKVLTGIASEAAGVKYVSDGDELASVSLKRLRAADIEDLAKLAGAFTKRHSDMEDTVIETVDLQLVERGHHQLLPRANIEQIATLTRATMSHPNENSDDNIEALASEVTMRGQDLLPQANIEQIATLAEAANLMHPNEITDDNIKTLALEVIKRGDDLVPHASVEELATLTAAFSCIDEVDCRTALAKVADETAKRDEETLRLHDTQRRPPLDNRDRSIER